MRKDERHNIKLLRYRREAARGGGERLLWQSEYGPFLSTQLHVKSNYEKGKGNQRQTLTQTMKGQAKRRWERKQRQMDAMFLMENRMPKLESRYQRATVGELMVKQKRCTATKSEVLKADLVNSAATQWWKKYASWLSEERGKHSVSARRSHMKHKELWESELLLESF